MMKYRRNKVKREHGLIQNALHWLENLSSLEEVADIIPGVIEVSHSSERRVVYKYETKTGCKLLLKSNGSIQEVFVVTKNPAVVREWVAGEFPLELTAVKTKNRALSKLSAGKQKSKPRSNPVSKHIACKALKGPEDRPEKPERDKRKIKRNKNKKK